MIGSRTKIGVWVVAAVLAPASITIMNTTTFLVVEKGENLLGGQVHDKTLFSSDGITIFDSSPKDVEGQT